MSKQFDEDKVDLILYVTYNHIIFYSPICSLTHSGDFARHSCDSLL